MRQATDADRSAGEGKENWLDHGRRVHASRLHPAWPAGRIRRLVLPVPRVAYDTAGRIRKGPAPENMAVPLFTFTSDTVVKIG